MKELNALDNFLVPLSTLHGNVLHETSSLRIESPIWPIKRGSLWAELGAVLHRSYR